MASLTSPLSTFGNQPSQDVIVSQQQTIVALQQQVNTIQSEVTGINSGLQGISTLIQNDNLLDQTKLLEEQKREKLLAESGTRQGKEEELEKRLEASLVKPVQALEPKLTSVFDRTSGALKLLFSGFLGTGVIQGISGVARFAIQGFTSVRSFVGKTLGFVGSSIAWLRNGFNGVVRSIGGVIGKVGGVIATLAKSPFKAIGDLFKKASGGVSRAASSAAGAAVRAGGGLLDDIFKGGLGVLKGLGKAAPLLGGAGAAAVDIASGEDPKKAIAGGTGAAVGGGLGAFLGAPLGPLGSIGLSVLGGTVGQNIGKTGYEAATQLFGGGDKSKESSAPEVQPQTPAVAPPPAPSLPPPSPTPAATPAQTPAAATPSQTPAIQPQTPAIPPPPSQEMAAKFQMAWDNRNNPLAKGRIQSAWNNMDPEQQKQAQTWAESKGYNWEEMKLKPKESPTIQPTPKPEASVGSLPEPKPNVIMASSVSQNPPRNQNPPRSGPITDVPLISSFNSDNFYTLYAQTHYNVVM